MPVKPAERLSLVTEYYFSRKLKEVAEMNAAGRDIISLAIGSPDMPPSEQTIEKLCETAHDPAAHGYQPTAGTPELRRAMAFFYKKTYDVDLDPDTEILPLIGSKEGILHTTLAFVNPGEGVLVPNPGYPTYTSLSKLLGAKVISYDLKEENGRQPDFFALEGMNLAGARLMWTNYPHMPTGGNARRETYERLVDFARRRELIVVNDNPYSLILNRKPLSILQIPSAKNYCLEFNSMSKSFNMPGWRVGMVAGKAEYISWILKVKSNIDSGTFRGIQLAAAAALTGNTKEWHEEYNINVYRRRRVLAERIMTVLGCTYDASQTGMFLWGRIPEEYRSCEELTERVLDEARVFITPGFIFGSNGDRYIRISLCAKDDKMAEALGRIEAIINK